MLMTNNALILDLDNTIFPTRSMDKRKFKPFIDDLSERLHLSFDNRTVNNIINNMWDRPADYVMKKYQIDYWRIKESFDIISDLNMDFNIKPYPDYYIIKNIRLPKFLITNGIFNLQMAKINSLHIGNDFDEIFINDFISDKKTKKELFRELIKKHGLTPGLTYVIGDNPDSEIKAGNELNMVTIQILRGNIAKGENAAYYIQSFAELSDIID